MTKLENIVDISSENFSNLQKDFLESLKKTHRVCFESFNDLCTRPFEFQHKNVILHVNLLFEELKAKGDLIFLNEKMNDNCQNLQGVLLQLEALLDLSYNTYADKLNSPDCIANKELIELFLDSPLSKHVFFQLYQKYFPIVESHFTDSRSSVSGVNQFYYPNNITFKISNPSRNLPESSYLEYIEQSGGDVFIRSNASAVPPPSELKSPASIKNSKEFCENYQLLKEALWIMDNATSEDYLSLLKDKIRALLI
jgi:hypothetical protein